MRKGYNKMLITNENLKIVRHSLRGWTTAYEVAERTNFTFVEARTLLSELEHRGMAKSKEVYAFLPQGKRHTKGYTWI